MPSQLRLEVPARDPIGSPDILVAGETLDPAPIPLPIRSGSCCRTAEGEHIYFASPVVGMIGNPPLRGSKNWLLATLLAGSGDPVADRVVDGAPNEQKLDVSDLVE